MAKFTYRGFEIEQETSGLWVWLEPRTSPTPALVVHNGKVDTQGGFKTSDAAVADIDKWKKEQRS